ncbi:ACP phosphodiesterase [Flavobacterium sp. H122]|uniref:acyl carrier protein phosphodiesterase n=1 Tax=Flavobacterium sp. H122 TaxID=2529860 RepID=UPI0010AAB9F9|nr:ACP phosphodiesterase [Flavobacterium sp. H122]
MNFLAHIYLSGDNELLKIGNFMADGIRGKDYLHFDPEIQKGVLLHRLIDTFTDAHPVYRQSKHRLHEKYGHYSGVIMDIFYDHFLAKNWSNYHEKNLDSYADDFYQSLQNNYDQLTEKTKKMMPYMIGRNWFVSYATVGGLEMILFQMDYRTKHRANMPEAINELLLFHNEFENEFTIFFDELIKVCAKWRAENG